ncbi:butyrophilin subfamily 3 member A1-like [Hemibagrus wyckioides]|uniref:butyrophilin subfamily 3 member A1-like n=1 Tax=Hemibagrus wyckioides TaxID=337641 RepID=UPI00266C2A9D|nr:butyrophilin subfamily 3 member A1-like [Hemibagrus wyckioides]
MLPINNQSLPSKPTQGFPDIARWVACSTPWSKPNLSNKKPDLTRIQSLGECFQFLTDMAKEVEDINKGRNKSTLERHKKGAGEDSVPVDVESSKSLILSWAKELDRLNMSRGLTKKASVKAEVTEMKDKDVCDISKDSERIMKWAQELQTVTENLSLTDGDLRQILTNHSVTHRKLDEVLHFLEFVVWTLLSHDSEDVSKIWLPVKQREWKTRRQKYIPYSVWQWIQSASVDVLLDSSSCHPWLYVSEDKLKVYELHNPPRQQQRENPQIFDKQPFVLGLNGFSTGRHYWEVKVPAEGKWRLGVAAASAQRKGRFHIAPGTGYWTICNRPERLQACTDPRTELPNSVPLQVVGVYVDYEEGQVSFYNGKSRFHIYTFSQTFREVLFPVFACLDGKSVLKICTS